MKNGRAGESSAGPANRYEEERESKSLHLRPSSESALDGIGRGRRVDLSCRRIPGEGGGKS